MDIIPHTAAELRTASDAVHTVAGLLLALAGATAVLQRRGYLAEGATRYLSPATLLFVGIFLVGFLLFHHGLSELGRNWNTLRIDPQQMEHLLMGVLVAVGGATELLRERRTLRHRAWGLVWPGVLGAVGLLFAAHTQHGDHGAVTWAVLYHQLLGVVLTGAALLKAADLFADEDAWPRYAYGGVLLLAALMLLSYNEPEGAYEDHPAVQAYEDAASPASHHH